MTSREAPPIRIVAEDARTLTRVAAFLYARDRMPVDQAVDRAFEIFDLVKAEGRRRSAARLEHTNKGRSRKVPAWEPCCIGDDPLACEKCRAYYAAKAMP